MIVSLLKFRLTAALYAVFLTVMPSSCGNDTDYKQIDFRPRIEIAAPDENASGRKPLKAAVASMVSPKESFAFYRKIIHYIGGKLNRDIELIQRKTYGEINEMLLKGDIDFAFICTGPYVTGREKFGFEAVAAPVLRGKPLYQAYLIVHKDSDFQSLPDLQGKVFAFTDPQSNTGAMVPRYWLSLDGFRPEDFFRSYTYTYSHDNSIMAVARKMADGATVFGHIWDYYQENDATYTSRTRIIKKSDFFGSPPLVASNRMDPELKSALTELVLAMHEDPEGMRILSDLMIDRFEKPQLEWYAKVQEMLNRLPPGKDRVNAP